MEKTFRFFMVAALVVFLSFVAAGCSKKKVQTDVGVSQPESMQPAMQEEKPAMERGIYESGMAAEPESLDTQAMAMEEPSEILEGRTNGPMLPVYFDFDKSNIREDQTDRLADNGDFLAKNGMVRIRIEGNCDERGTNEYNMALGQRRAESAKKYLVNLGIDANRLETISYGEEKPLLFGHDEYSWAQNRRDDFVIVK
jgi:peptidoglycan-associated lipoprotein